ncbi:glycosyltransferase [Candidatus Saccharibacteria bacterium]|nr:glycosyltransferase [Candidatus Saccharibacteria bacterium]
MKDSIKKSVAYVVENTDNIQFKYRVKNIIEALGGNRRWSGKCYLKNEIQKINFREINILIISRQTEKGYKIIKLIKIARVAGVRVLFDVDDSIFDYQDLRLIKDSVQEKSLLYWIGYFWGVRRIAKKVDGFLCTNEFLAEKLKRSFGKPVKVIRNSLNEKQVEISEKLIKEKLLKKDKNRDFLIGYFSGSPTHARDFAMIEDELMRFLEKNEDARLRVVGYMDFSQKMKKMIGEGKVETIGVVDYLELEKMVAEVDVNIAPLVVNDFTNCKSELKFFEAGVVETTTIASSTYAFKKAIKDGENGFLAQTGEWYDKLEYLYKHPTENRKIAKKAREYALKHYYGKEFLEEVETAYDYFAK